MARMEWQDEAIFDGVLLDQQDNVIECTMSNIFARFGNTLITPDLSQCGVAGITRQQVISHAKLLDLTTKIETLSLPQLLQADEVIVCNSLYGAFQVTRVANTTWAPQILATHIRNLLVHD